MAAIDQYIVCIHKMEAQGAAVEESPGQNQAPLTVELGCAAL